MGSIDKQSVREELDKIKASFHEQQKAGEISAKTALLFDSSMTFCISSSIFWHSSSSISTAFTWLGPEAKSITAVARVLDPALHERWWGGDELCGAWVAFFFKTGSEEEYASVIEPHGCELLDPGPTSWRNTGIGSTEMRPPLWTSHFARFAGGSTSISVTCPSSFIEIAAWTGCSRLWRSSIFRVAPPWPQMLAIGLQNRGGHDCELLCQWSWTKNVRVELMGYCIQASAKPCMRCIR